MRFTRFLTLSMLGCVAVEATLSDMEQLESLAESALDTAYRLLDASNRARSTSTCSWANIQIRREW